MKGCSRQEASPVIAVVLSDHLQSKYTIKVIVLSTR